MAQKRTQVIDYIIKKSSFQVKLFISKKFFPAGTQGIEIFFGGLYKDFDFFPGEGLLGNLCSREIRTTRYPFVLR